MKLLFYNASILPLFDYGCVVWGIQKTNYVNKVFNIQKRVARIILKQPKKSKSEELFNKLQWITFHDRVSYHTALLVYKSCNNLASSYMKDIFFQKMFHIVSVRRQINN